MAYDVLGGVLTQRGEPVYDGFMRQIPLTNSTMFALVDDEDYAKVNLYNWGYYFNDRGHGTVKTKLRGSRKNIPLARYILNDLSSQTVDHIDRNPLNNQKSNLRSTTFKVNAQNTTPFGKTSKYKGVSLAKRMIRFGKPWTAQINVNKHVHYLGCFETQEEAAEVYNKAALKFFGSHAFLNVIE